MSRISPSQIKQRVLDRPTLPNLFANSAKPVPLRTAKLTLQSKNISTMVHNGSDPTIELTSDIIDMSSPYSPGSTLSDGLFDPPSPAANWSPIGPSYKNRKEKKDVFDSLFDSSPVVQKGKGKYKKNDKDKRKKSVYRSQSGKNAVLPRKSLVSLRIFRFFRKGVVMVVVRGWVLRRTKYSS